MFAALQYDVILSKYCKVIYGFGTGLYTHWQKVILGCGYGIYVIKVLMNTTWTLEYFVAFLTHLLQVGGLPSSILDH